MRANIKINININILSNKTTKDLFGLQMRIRMGIKIKMIFSAKDINENKKNGKKKYSWIYLYNLNTNN